VDQWLRRFLRLAAAAEVSAESSRAAAITGQTQVGTPVRSLAGPAVESLVGPALPVSALAVGVPTVLPPPAVRAVKANVPVTG